MTTREAVQGALRAYDARSAARVLDLVQDSDLDGSTPAQAPRRLRFQRDGLSVDVVVQDEPGGLHVLAHVSPRQPFLARALTRGPELAVLSACRSDAAGAARLSGLPRGVTSLHLEPAGGPPLRTAWVRM